MIKKLITGDIHADKKEIQEIIRILLKLDKIPEPNHAADALGIAICSAYNTIIN
jgi:crossover junction endodeoxyribonuclease RuvC